FGFYGDRSYRPPLIPIYIAILRSLFGEAVWNILTPLFTGLSLAALFLIGRRLFDMKAGLIAAGLMAFSTLFVFYSGRLLTEIPGIFLSALSLYFMLRAFDTFSKKDLLLFSIFTVCAFLAFYRFIMVVVSIAAFVLIFRFGAVLKNFKSVAATAAISLLLLVPLFYYSHANFGSFYGLFTLSYFNQAPEPLEYFLLLLPHILSNVFVIALLALALLYGFLYGNKQMKYASYLVIIIFISASVLLNHKEDRYLMPLFPILFLVIGAFSSAMVSDGLAAIRSISSQAQKFEADAARIAIFMAVIIMLYLGTLGNITGAFQLFEYKKGSFGDVKEAAMFVRDNSAPDEVFMTDSVTAMFYADRTPFGFNGGNLTFFIDSLSQRKPSYLLITAYESRDYYINALNNYQNAAPPSNSVEYVLKHPEKFQLLKLYPSQASPYVMVFKVIG
ncbi:MAG TPA: glycosyltransferase family 39 protein, partial [Candidatus Norongarragalinales archaeon]|nr:glycosyltransferase family 39 protein [Candidatus Norongarragalinales archaeon]